MKILEFIGIVLELLVGPSIRRKLWRYGPGLVFAFVITGLGYPWKGEFVETFAVVAIPTLLLVGWGIFVRRKETKEELREVLLASDIQRLVVFKDIRGIVCGTADDEARQKFEKERKELKKKVKQDRLDVWAWAAERLPGGVLPLRVARVAGDDYVRHMLRWNVLLELSGRRNRVVAGDDLGGLLRWVQEQLDGPWPPERQD